MSTLLCYRLACNVCTQFSVLISHFIHLFGPLLFDLVPVKTSTESAKEFIQGKNRHKNKVL